MKKNLLSIIFALISTLGFSQAPSYVPANGLVGWWPFNGNANDESGNGNNGTVNGATLTTDRNGLTNSSFNFNVNNWSPGGSGGDKIYIPYNPSFNFSDFTISTWVKRTSSAGGIINRFQYGYNNPNGETWILEFSNNILYGTVIEQSPSPAQSFYSQSNQTELLNQWCNIIMTYSQNTINLFINNQLVGTSSDPSITINTVGNSGITIGLSEQANGQWQPFDGSIDDIGIWNRALTQQEITNLYTSTVPPTASVLSGDATICLGSSTNLSIAVTGGTAPYTITVTDGTNNYTATGASPVSIPVSPTATSTYTIVSVSGGGTGTGNTGTATVTITPSSTNTTPISACNSYSWNGTTYSASGVYTGTTASCVTESLNLIITPSSTNTTTATACESYTWNETTYTSSGVYTGNTANCVTESLNLTITPSSTNTTTASACDSYVWNGTTYTATGVYTGATTNCVTESLDLTITPSSANTTAATACDSYAWNGQAYTQSGVYTGTTTDCVTQSLNLTITPSSTNTTTASACNNYTWNGQTYTQSGVYTGTTANCVTESLNLTINPNTSSSISQTALDSFTWPVNNQTYTTTGAYTAVIPNAAGCDSTITLNLTMSFTGINDLSASKLTIYPNPTNGDFTITGLELVGTVSYLSLTDMNGKVVKVLDTKATKFSMGSIKPGVYFLNIISGNKEEVLKIVKE